MNFYRFYFTFGRNTTHADYFQMIIARNYEEAEKEMFKQWGKFWAFGYTEKEYIEAVQTGTFAMLKPLETRYASKQSMKTEEMKAWTTRLNCIMESEKEQKESRLLALKNDIEIATDFNNDIYANLLHSTIKEEMKGAI